MVAKPQLVCPAGSLAALKAAVDNGADDVYLGFRNDTNARNFAGLNFDDKSLAEGIRYAHQRGRKVLAAINTYAQAGRFADWTRSVDTAAKLGIDAVIIADPGVLDYAAQTYPDMRRHLSVQASATSYEAVNFCREKFGIQRAVLPRVLTLAQVENVIRNTEVEIEVFGFGSLCVMNEGRCWLSSYATGQSPNMNGVCSPAGEVRYTETPQGITSELGGFTINKFAHNEPAGYPTLCKGRFIARDKASYLFEEPTSLNTLTILPDLIKAGVTAFKIEGRQRGRAYVAAVVQAFRQGVDAVMAGKPLPDIDLDRITEGGKQTTGAYEKAWR